MALENEGDIDRVRWLMTPTAPGLPTALHELVHRPSWQRQAACRDESVDVFFPGRGQPAAVARARAFCASCPVRQECLDYVLSLADEPEGIWGGTSGRERRRLRSARRAA